MRMGTGQLLCLILGVLFLAVGGGMLGGRFAPEISGATPLERASDTMETVGTPDAKRLFAAPPVEFQRAGEPEEEQGLKVKPIPVAESDASVAPGKGAPVVEDPIGESRSKYVIQAISTSSHPDARTAREAIAAVGFPSGVFEAELPGKGKWYRVYIGPYDSEEEARSALEGVRRIPGFDGSFLKALE